jgi:predicted RNA-binding protein YlqC (UPF0109 family)
MDYVNLVEYLVKNLVKEPEMVAVKRLEDEECILIEVLVAEADMGVVIGKGGSIANAMRTIVQATSYINKDQKVRINIDSF